MSYVSLIHSFGLCDETKAFELSVEEGSLQRCACEILARVAVGQCGGIGLWGEPGGVCKVIKGW